MLPSQMSSQVSLVGLYTKLQKIICEPKYIQTYFQNIHKLMEPLTIQVVWLENLFHVFELYRCQEIEVFLN